MTSPAYHLRPNKAADRFALIEAIRRLARLGDGGLGAYTYYGLGGPYLEDFRLLYEFCPEIGMVSIEEKEETYKRQEFHRPCSSLQLIKDTLSSFIAHYDPGDSKSIFWLDYTGLDYSCFEDFQSLLGVVVEDSMVKVTLRSDPSDYWTFRPPRPKQRRAEEFRAKFGGVMRDSSAAPPRSPANLARLLQEMLQVAAQQVLPPATEVRSFVPVSSFYYSDRTWMFTLTGVVCQAAKRGELEQAFADWEFANLTWDRPKRIDVPVLSTKERLHLQHLLPSTTTPGKTLRESLGYLIHDSIEETEAALEQYAAFHRYSPYVLRGVP